MIGRLLTIALAFGLALTTSAFAGGDECPSCPGTPGKVCPKGDCTAECGGDCKDGACTEGECCGACEKGAAVKAPPLSARIAELAANAEHGCDVSKTTLDAFAKACGADCSTTLLAQVTDLEAKAGKGCRTSGWKLAVMTARLDGKPAPKAPMSVRVSMLIEKAAKGCEKSQATLTAIEAECGAACDSTMVKGIEKLEDMAAKGCEESKTRLAALAELMPAPARADGQPCCGKEGCTGCGQGGGCDGGECPPGACPGGKAADGACPADKPADGKGACPSECPQGKKTPA